MAKKEQTDLIPIAEELAEILIDEKIVRQPELAKQRDQLIEHTKAELTEELNVQGNEIVDDMRSAFETLAARIEALPPAEKERLRADFKKAAELSSSDKISKDLMESLAGAEQKPLQTLLGIRDETMQFIYAAAYQKQEEKDFEKSRPLFRLLVLLNAYVQDFWVGLGFSLLNLNRLEEARTAFETAVSFDPENPRGLYFLSVCLASQKDYDHALDACESGLELSKAHRDAKVWQQSFTELKQVIKDRK